MTFRRYDKDAKLRANVENDRIARERRNIGSSQDRVDRLEDCRSIDAGRQVVRWHSIGLLRVRDKLADVLGHGEGLA